MIPGEWFVPERLAAVIPQGFHPVPSLKETLLDEILCKVFNLECLCCLLVSFQNCFKTVFSVCAVCLLVFRIFIGQFFLI